jgi:hypothetical protein
LYQSCVEIKVVLKYRQRFVEKNMFLEESRLP